MARQRPGIELLQNVENAKCFWRGVAQSRLADSQHDFSEHMPFRQSLVRLGGLDQRKCFRDRDFELGGVDSNIESLEFADAGNPVIG
jgi:hypothetical protein